MAATVHILILAAGASSRMRGRDKLLEPVRGKPILRLVVDAAQATACPVFVALPAEATARRAALSGNKATLIDVPDCAEGMSRSIRRGVEAMKASPAGPEDGVMILPADMPGFTTKVLADLVSRFRAEPQLIWRGGSVDGTPGHPAIFPRDLWDDLAAITGDEGGRSVLQRHKDRVRVVPLPGDIATLDLDTPEEWDAYLARPRGLL